MIVARSRKDQFGAALLTELLESRQVEMVPSGGVSCEAIEAVLGMIGVRLCGWRG